MIAIAERLQLTEIATLDQRHFGVVRPSHSRALTLLPGSDACAVRVAFGGRQGEVCSAVAVLGHS